MTEQRGPRNLLTALNNVDCQAEVKQFFEIDNAASILFALLEEKDKAQRHESAKGIISLIKNKLYIGKILFEKGCVIIFLRYIQYHRDYTFKALMIDALRELCILDEAFANQIVERLGIETYMIMVNYPSEEVKFSAAWAIAYLAKSSKRLAEEVVQRGAVPPLVYQISTGSIKGRLAVIAALYHISVQSAELSEVSVWEQCTTSLLDNMRIFKDISVQYQCLSTLASIANSNCNVAQMIAHLGAIVEALKRVRSWDCKVACTACYLLANMMHHHREMAERVAAHTGCIIVILNVIDTFESSERKWSILCIGYIAALSNTKAMEVLLAVLPNGKTFAAVLDGYLMVETDEDALNSIMWLLYSLALYSHKHADYVCHTMIMKKCVEWHNCATSPASVKVNSMKTLTLLLGTCGYPPALNALLPGITEDLLKMSLGQYMKILPNDATSRKVFFTSGALQKLQQIHYSPRSVLESQITAINRCYPTKLIKFTEERFKKGLITEMPRLPFLDSSYLSYSDLDSDSELDLGISRKMETDAEPLFMSLEPTVFDSLQPSTSVMQLNTNTSSEDFIEFDLTSDPPRRSSIRVATNDVPVSVRRPSASVTTLRTVSAAAPGSDSSEEEVEQHVRRKLTTLLKGPQF